MEIQKLKYRKTREKGGVPTSLQEM